MINTRMMLRLLAEIKDQLEPLKDALHDDGLEVYSEDIHDVLDNVDSLIGMANRSNSETI